MEDLTKVVNRAVVYSDPPTIKSEIVELPIEQPGPGQVLVRLLYSGVCHTDYGICTNAFDTLPIGTPKGQVGGHEGVGKVVARGLGVEYPAIGATVGIKWSASACLSCDNCLEGGETTCQTGTISGFLTPGTFQQYCLSPANYVTPIPEGIDLAAAAPLMCGGVSVYTALKRARVQHGQWVVISGAGGGLGHLAIQYAKALGARVLALDAGEKEEFCLGLQADAFVNFTRYKDDKDIASEVQRITGSRAKVVLVCSSNNRAYDQAISFLGFRGTLACLGAPEGASVPIGGAKVNDLIGKELTIFANKSGNRLDAKESLEIAAAGKVKTQYQIRPMKDLTAEEILGSETTGDSERPDLAHAGGPGQETMVAHHVGGSTKQSTRYELQGIAREMASPIQVGSESPKGLEKTVKEVPSTDPESTPSAHSTASIDEKPPPPWSWKLTAVILVTLIRFGGSWSSGITGAMKSTLKKELSINNTQYALLEASEDFMVTVLILLSGLLTDRIGGASALFYGNIVYSIGSILVAAAAQVRSFNFMIGGRVILAIGDIATQVAQYQVFSAWFAPSNGFGSTLGLELMVAKLGAFAGTGSANVIAKKTGNFAWVFWVAVLINFFTNVMSALFYWFNKKSSQKFGHSVDPVTGEKLMKKGKRLEVRKVLELPWVFWILMAYSLFYTSTAIIFSGNATELAEQRFDIDSVTAGWYTALLRYAGFFLVPIVGVFIDVMGQRISLLAISSFGVFIAMALVNWAPAIKGTAAAFGIYAVASTYNPTVLIDSMRTSLWKQTTFGSAYALKIMMNNSANIIVRIVAGVIQDADNNSYDRVVILYICMAAASVVLSCTALTLAWRSPDLRQLQWSRKKRLAKTAFLVERKERFHGVQAPLNRQISRTCFGLLMLLLVGGWASYIWGAVTGHNN
ncbi:hypothetical protein JX265_013050 [Neoarthrinium moseri]|uniref:Major facilitator superfamily (MFS) profile domain-containing protein n=1 Tax=Neoarthrinium moseri TaxID=1658444 RepID=A0A9P9W943_9PEZI|nr:hypothetical protein JX265_013050 [Neoarthrinium moseri]